MSDPTNNSDESPECISDTIEPMPVNKITSFHGKLDQFLHANSPDSPSKQTSSTSISSSLLEPSQEQATHYHPAMAKATPAPRRKPKTKTKSTLSTPIEATRVTRSRSKTISPSTPSTPIPIDLVSPTPALKSKTETNTILSTTTRVTRPRSKATSPSPSTPIDISTTSLPLNTPTPKRRKRRPQVPSDTPPASASLLRDTVPPNLLLLLVGVNPGLQTYQTGFAYAHPSNLFWRLLHTSGITSIRHPPSDTYKLPGLYSVGNTNIVHRPTRDASMLTKAEMNEGVATLEAKVAAQRPEAVCLVGKGIWEAVWRVRHGREIRKEEFRYGWQVESENMGVVVGESWGGAPVFVATTTSGLAAGMKLAEKEAVWAEIGGWVVKRRAERGFVAEAVGAVGA